MSKTAITFIGIIALIALGIFAISRNSEPDAAPLGEEEASDQRVISYEDGQYRIVPEESTIAWGGSFLNGSRSHSGTVAVREGSVSVEDGAITGGSIEVDMARIAEDSGSAVADHLKSDDFFGVEEYPTAAFSVTGSGPREDASEGFVLVGDMVIRGITREVEVPAVVAGTPDGGILISGELSLDRSLWEVRYGSASFFDNLGDKVIDDTITVSFVLQGEPAVRP